MIFLWVFPSVSRVGGMVGGFGVVVMNGVCEICS